MIVHLALVALGVGLGWAVAMFVFTQSLRDDIASLDAEREELHHEWQALAEHRGAAVVRPVSSPDEHRILGARLIGIHVANTTRLS